MSPTVFRVGGMRFFFFSREEERIHVHVLGPEGEAKIWIEPTIAVARNWGLAQRDLRWAIAIVGEKEDEIREAWRRHFGR